jgi:nitrite reductase (cytochrome c-552)
MPDISTKEKAQVFIGLNPEKMKADKEEFLKTTVVKWDEEAKQRQGFLYEYKLKN